jgi:hypothetical protein
MHSVTPTSEENIKQNNVELAEQDGCAHAG